MKVDEQSQNVHQERVGKLAHEVKPSPIEAILGLAIMFQM